MAEVVFLLCAATSVACAILLYRGYRTSHSRLLLWSSLCFVGLSFNNVLLFVDRVVVPAADLSMVRGVIGVVALMLLLFGLVQEFK